MFIRDGLSEVFGQFLPISVWVQMGYDDTAIMEKTKKEDKGTHDVLGCVYRGKIHQTRDSKLEEEERVQVLRNLRLRTAAKRALPAEDGPNGDEAADAAAVKPSKKAKALDSSDDDDSSSSSSCEEKDEEAQEGEESEEREASEGRR